MHGSVRPKQPSAAIGLPQGLAHRPPAPIEPRSATPYPEARMDEALTRNVFLVKEHTGLFKAANNYDIFDPETGKAVLECREEKLGWITKILRFSDYKRMTPFHIEIRRPDGAVLVQVKRGIALFASHVEVLDGQNQRLGSFKQKLFSLGGAFEVLDALGMPACALKGKWTGWEFKFTRDGVELATVTKKWAGIGRELLTSADNYVLAIADSVPSRDPLRPLILAAVMCIDMVLKE